MVGHDRPYRPLSILVVDDLADAAQSEADLLCLLGYRVRIALNGANALVCMAAEPADVVLLVLRMPPVDLSVALTIRERCAADNKQPLIVAVTGCGTAGDHLRSAEAGFDLHLVKPVDPVMLADVLERFRRSVTPPVAADEFASLTEDHADSDHGSLRAGFEVQ